MTKLVYRLHIANSTLVTPFAIHHFRTGSTTVLFGKTMATPALYSGEKTLRNEPNTIPAAVSRKRTIPEFTIPVEHAVGTSPCKDHGQSIRNM